MNLFLLVSVDHLEVDRRLASDSLSLSKTGHDSVVIYSDVGIISVFEPCESLSETVDEAFHKSSLSLRYEPGL